jgi:predicted amino acid dehydrogenase
VKRVLVVHLGEQTTTETVTFLGQDVVVERRGCDGDTDLARRWIADHDGEVDAIGLDGLPTTLRLGGVSRPHAVGASLRAVAETTPVVDGAGIRGGLERWGIILADRAEPGIFAHKRVLMVPGLNHGGMAEALQRHAGKLRYADPLIYFNLPRLPGVGDHRTLDQAAARTLDQLQDAPFRRLFAQPGTPGTARASAAFDNAHVIAGDIGAIRRYAPDRLARKTVVVEHASEEDLADLQGRDVAIVVTLMPSLGERGALGRWSAAAIEAVLVALRSDTSLPLDENTYLDLIADIDWHPHVRYLRQEDAEVNRFAFVIHPLDVGFVHANPMFRWTKLVPDAITERVAARIPPLYLSRISGGRSPTTGQQIEGYLIALGATPRQMMKRDERVTYQQLHQAAIMSERLGARIMGLGAFTSVVGDAGITVAHEADIAITSGNSLTVAATLEAAKQAVVRMGRTDLTTGTAMVVGATGSIGSVCARLLAQAIDDVVLVSIEPERLIDLKRRIQAESPQATVRIATKPDEHLGECDLVVTATSAFGERIVDISQCKPGAVICDVARPEDISPQEAALRPDVLVIESGEVLIPGDIDFGYNIGLPPKTAYACLAETALLAMEGRFEDYTLGRNIEMDRVKEIYRLFKKHRFELAGLRSFGAYLTDEDLAAKRAEADRLRADPEHFARVRDEAATRIAAMPPTSKHVGGDRRGEAVKWAGLGATTGLAAMGARLALRAVRQDDPTRRSAGRHAP